MITREGAEIEKKENTTSSGKAVPLVRTFLCIGSWFSFFDDYCRKEKSWQNNDYTENFSFLRG